MMAATCVWCEEPMDGRACDGKPLAETAVVESVSYYRIPHAGPGSCHDCRTPQGGLHHPGCDTERCPRCLGQALSCGCRWENDQPDPEFDEGMLADESPSARRYRARG
jgi:hypothetical protein